MTPALAQPWVFPWAPTRALAVPSPATFCDSKRNWSPVPQMSPPPPCTVQLPLSSDWVPAGVAPPISAHVHPLGQVNGGGGAVGASATSPNATVLSVPELCAVTARPASIASSPTTVPLE